jgi:hypothetical protein
MCRLTNECGNFETAIAHVRFRLLCFITVIEYDVPKELRADFQEVCVGPNRSFPTYQITRSSGAM